MSLFKKNSSKGTIRTFALASFLNDLGADIINPIWPLFLTNVLGVDMRIVGLIDGIGDAVVSISQAISGNFSDRFRRRKVFIWVGYLFGGLSRLGYALVATWPMAVLFKIMDRSGKMRDAPRDAMVADASHFWNRGANFGVLRAFDNLGGICGTLLSLLLIRYLPLRDIFMIAALPSFLGVLMIGFWIHEKPAKAKVYEGLHFKNLDLNFKWFLTLSALFSLGTFSYSFLLIYSQAFHIDTYFVPIFYLIFTGIATVSSYPFGRLSDKIGRKSVIQISFLLWALTLTSFILFHNLLSVLISFVIYGLFKGAIDTVQRAYVAELSPTIYRASALGTFKMIVGLAALPSSIMAGYLWEKIDPNAPLYFSLALTALASVMLMLVKSRKPLISNL